MGALSKPSLVVVLVEDERQQRLVRRYLRRVGYEPHDIRYVPLPGGAGCGEQWVRERYAAEVQEYRSRSARARTALVVAIDADTVDADTRGRQLNNALAEAGSAVRGTAEMIVHLIPRRSVETWILCLNGENVDETTDYSKEREIDQMIGPAALTLFDWSRENYALPAHCFPSLSSAVFEVRRLDTCP